jgi:hypothetical protein
MTIGGFIGFAESLFIYTATSPVCVIRIPGYSATYATIGGLQTELHGMKVRKRLFVPFSH